MKTCKKLLLFVLVLGLVFTNTATVQAATKINKKSATMYVGQTTTLKISGTKTKAKWSSSNKSIATVNSKGKVTAKKKGNVKITAKVGKKKYTCKVTVKNPSLNKTKLSLEKGKTCTLKLNGSKVKSWASSNKKIASVDKKGKVTAKKKGNATITAVATNGKKYACKVSVTKNSSNSNNEDKHTHNYTSKVTTQPTCTENGTRTYTCSCGASYTETISATGHSWSNWKVTKEATENSTGTKQRSCSTCKKVETKTIDKLEHTHSYTSKVTKKATCTENGIKTYTCSCGDSYTEKIPATGHTWSDWTVTKEATETSTGLKERTCSVCKTTETKTIDKVVHKHNYSSKITTQPTCTADGIKTYTCSCGDSYTETIPAIGHNYVSEVVAPTCTTGGYTSHTCSRCGDNYIDNYVDSIEHNCEWVVTKEPTCSENGLKEYKCVNCGEITGKSEIPASHNYGDWVVTKKPSDGAATSISDFGIRQRTCSLCNHVDEQTIINIDLGNGETKQICGVFDDSMAYETFSMVNELRTSLGLNELTWFDKFSDISHIRAVEIDYLYEHNRPNGSGGVCYNSSNTLILELGENIGQGPTKKSARIQFDSWCNSSGHYANIVKSSYKKYYCSCFITYDNDGNPWYNWVQLFY